MSLEKPIPFFTDNDVEDSVGDFLIKSGHEVVRLRDVMLGNSPDPIVDANCRHFGLVLVTHNYRDFRKISQELESKGRGVKRLSKIEMKMHQSIGARRMEAALHLIEAEWLVYNHVQMTIGEETISLRR